jgi:hypothetical protein
MTCIELFVPDGAQNPEKPAEPAGCWCVGGIRCC